MNQKLRCLLFIFCTFSLSAISQILPREGSKLNYRIVGFSVPKAVSAGGYIFEVASGNHTTDVSFKKSIINTVKADSNKVVIEVPEFGKEYTWRCATDEGRLYHFSTTAIPNIDTLRMRLRILKEADTYKDAYVFLDGNMVLYDMKGCPVWYLPNVDGNTDERAEIRDLKCTPQGTITFINGELAYEISYSGDILWRPPNTGQVSGENREYYHHEFTRLSNGHYMILGNDFAVPKVYTEEKKNERKGNLTPVEMTQFGTIIEYDGQGKVVWSCKSSKFHKDRMMYYPKKPNGSRENETHENAFYFNEKTKMAYLSFKNINQVVKVRYPEGNVVRSYGKFNKPGDTLNTLFCDQHSCKLTKKGYLLLFNNNMCNWPSKPRLIMFSEPTTAADVLKKVWEYETSPEVTSNLVKETPYTTSGGNVIEMPDQSVFASMCTPYSGVFIVGIDKKIRWNAVAEKRIGASQAWLPVAQYRASIITREQMHQMVLRQ